MCEQSVDEAGRLPFFDAVFVKRPQMLLHRALGLDRFGVRTVRTHELGVVMDGPMFSELVTLHSKKKDEERYKY